MGEKGCECCKKWQEHYYWEHIGMSKTKFFKFMTEDFHQRIRIPDKFASNFIKQIHSSQGFDLKVPSGETWHVGVTKVANDLFFSSGWGDFVKAHELQENDLLVFIFNGNSSFKVLIFDASGCEKLSSLFASKMHKHFYGMVGQQGEQYSLSDDSDAAADDDDDDDDNDSDDDTDDTSVPSQLIESPHKVSTFMKFSGKSKPRKELPESPNSSSSCDVKHEATEEEESDDDNFYYSRTVNRLLNDDEKSEIIGLASVQPGNPAFMTVLQTSHLKRQNNYLVVPIQFAAEHLHMSSHEVLLLRPNREDMWHVRYYQGRFSRGFGCQPWAKFVRDNKLRLGDVCIFELIKGRRKENKAARTMLAVHVARRKKSNGRFALVG